MISKQLQKEGALNKWQKKIQIVLEDFLSAANSTYPKHLKLFLDQLRRDLDAITGYS